MNVPDYSYSLVSTKKNPTTQKFSKATNRFRLGNDAVKLPGPGRYSPKGDSVNSSLVFKNSGQAVIGR